jgi:hypothetical protein
VSRLMLTCTTSLLAFGLSVPGAFAEPVSTAAAVKAWAGERLIANSRSVHRERNGVDRLIRLGGPSMRDIRKHGILGGRGSELRKIFG